MSPISEIHLFTLTEVFFLLEIPPSCLKYPEFPLTHVPMIRSYLQLLNNNLLNLTTSIEAIRLLRNVMHVRVPPTVVGRAVLTLLSCSGLSSESTRRVLGLAMVISAARGKRSGRGRGHRNEILIRL